MSILIISSLTARWYDKVQGDKSFSFSQLKVPGEIPFARDHCLHSWIGKETGTGKSLE